MNKTPFSPVDEARVEAYARARASGMGRAEAYASLPGVSPTAARKTLVNGGQRYEKHALARAAVPTARELPAAAPPPRERSGPPDGAGMSRKEIIDGLARIAGASDKHVKPNDRRQAYMDIARMEGHIIERVEHGRPGDFSKLSEPELDAEIERLSALVQIGAPARLRGPGVAPQIEGDEE